MSVFIGYPSFMAYQMMKGKKGNNMSKKLQQLIK